MKVKIELEVELPDIQHTIKQLDEYIRYTYRDINNICEDNPFLDSIGDDIQVNDLQWSQYIGLPASKEIKL